VAAACDVEPRPTERRQLVAGGDAAHAPELFQRYGCTACHVIPGVRRAQGKTGPPLTSWSQRRFIAGEAPNRPDLLVQWIRNPQSIRPGSAMPNVGVDDRDARHMAAYLYQLK
jgi:cytochrome c